MQLIACLIEVDTRRLYLREGCSSLFTWCCQVLHLSEHAAYGRIEAARAARKFPVILERLAEGSVTLTTVRLLASHLTPANHRELLANAAHKSKREVERQTAQLRPQPDVPATVRKLPAPQVTSRGIHQPVLSPDQPAPGAQSDALPVAAPAEAVERGLLSTDASNVEPFSTVCARSRDARSHASHVSSRPSVVQPLAPTRYKIQVTVDAATHEKLRQAQDLLRHVIPNGDPAAILDRALTVLLEKLMKQKLAATNRPRPRSTGARRPKSRHIPAAVKRAVWARDDGQCTFVGAQGRCRERGGLEFHHRVPYAAGGAADVENICLACRAHNDYQAEQDFGTRPGAHRR